MELTKEQKQALKPMLEKQGRKSFQLGRAQALRQRADLLDAKGNALIDEARAIRAEALRIEVSIRGV